jgi:hypothetical protein
MMQVKRKIDILNWLLPRSDSVTHEALQAKRVPKTGAWFLNDSAFNAWVSGTASQMLLCQGIGVPLFGARTNQSRFWQVNAYVGCTLSQLTSRSIAIEYLLSLCRQQNIAVVYIYFDYNDRQNQTPPLILRSLLKQVVSQLDTVPLPVIKLYEYCSSRASNPDLLTLLGQFLTCTDRFDAVYVLFDAFDECDDAQQNDILTLIHEFLRHSSIKILLTSRSQLQKSPRLPDFAHLTIKAKDADIRAFLSSRLESELYLSQEFKQDIIEVISQGAEGM